MKKEIWKDIIGYEGLYQISNLKRIKSLQRINERGDLLREKILKNTPKGIYEVITLYKKDNKKVFYVDKLHYLMFND